MSKKSFTLIELLITVTIFSVVSIVIYSTFDSGMRIWHRIEKFNLADIRNIMKMEKLNRELRQAFVFKEKDIAFLGKKDQVKFSVVIDSEVNEVAYFFDPASKAVLRSAEKLADILAVKEKKEGLSLKLIPYIEEVSEFSLSYFYYDIIKAAYLWKDEWKENTLPLAVKLNMILKNETYSTTVFIPSV